MKAVKWSADLLIGIEDIDQEHQGLIACLGDLVAACDADESAEVQGKLLEQLRQRTREHFVHEEDEMSKLGYPEFEAHQAIHGELISELDDIVEAFADTGSQGLSAETLQYLEDWLSQHIVMEDRKIGKFVGVAD
ncbi:bacteriohemerythrin [Pseudomonadota bacterium]